MVVVDENTLRKIRLLLHDYQANDDDRTFVEKNKRVLENIVKIPKTNSSKKNSD